MGGNIMFNKRKMLSLFVALLMITTVLVGCGSKSTSGVVKTPKEMVYDAFMNDLDVKTQEFKVDMSMSLSGTNVNDPQFDFISNMLNNSRIVLNGKTDTAAKKAEINANVNIGGMSFEGKMFINDRVIALNVPILGMMMNDPRLATGYVVIDSDKLMEELGQEQVDLFGNDEEMVKLATKIVEMYLDLLEESMFKNNGKKEITIANSNTNATEIDINIGETELKDIFTNAYTMINDPEFADLLFELVTISNPYMTRAEFDNDLNSLRREIDQNFDGDFDKVFEQIKEVIDFDNTSIKMSLYINDKSNIVKAVSDISLNFRDNETSVLFDLFVETDAWNINQPLTIEIPELNETNSVDFYELLFMYLGNVYY